MNANDRTIRVLVVDDSPVARDLLSHILGSDPDIEVVGVASDGREAVDAVSRLGADVVTVDIHMPGMDGFETTRRIMETNPTPVVIVTSNYDPHEVAITFRAMEAGALAVHGRPNGIGHSEYQSQSEELIRSVKLMSEVKVVRRWPRRNLVGGAPAGARVSAEKEIVYATRQPPAIARRDSRDSRNIELIAMGASTGGPLVLQTILEALPSNLPVPILIVQHIATGFVDGFVEWLGKSTGVQVMIAAHNETLQAGYAYVAPDGAHMSVSVGHRILLIDAPLENGMRPSVSYLFRSVAQVYGERAIGVLLTGMGKDGAWELKEMRDAGGVTIAQDRESSVVFGMPGEAVQLEAAERVLRPEEIAAFLTRAVNGI